MKLSRLFATTIAPALVISLVISQTSALAAASQQGIHIFLRVIA